MCRIHKSRRPTTTSSLVPPASSSSSSLPSSSLPSSSSSPSSLPLPSPSPSLSFSLPLKPHLLDDEFSYLPYDDQEDFPSFGLVPMISSSPSPSLNPSSLSSSSSSSIPSSIPSIPSSSSSSSSLPSVPSLPSISSSLSSAVNVNNQSVAGSLSLDALDFGFTSMNLPLPSPAILPSPSLMAHHHHLSSSSEDQDESGSMTGSSSSPMDYGFPTTHHHQLLSSLQLEDDNLSSNPVTEEDEDPFCHCSPMSSPPQHHQHSLQLCDIHRVPPATQQAPSRQQSVAKEEILSSGEILHQRKKRKALGSGIPPTTEEKRERNRLAAEKYRQKGRDTIATLSEKCCNLTTMNQDLLLRNKTLEDEVLFLRDMLRKVGAL